MCKIKCMFENDYKIVNTNFFMFKIISKHDFN